MYCETNYKTKAELRRAVAEGEQVHVFQPGPFPAKTNGRATIEGPHYPQPHRWYATVELQDGVITRVVR